MQPLSVLQVFAVQKTREAVNASMEHLEEEQIVSLPFALWPVAVQKQRVVFSVWDRPIVARCPARLEAAVWKILEDQNA